MEQEPRLTGGDLDDRRGGLIQVQAFVEHDFVGEGSGPSGHLGVRSQYQGPCSHFGQKSTGPSSHLLAQGDAGIGRDRGGKSHLGGGEGLHRYPGHDRHPGQVGSGRPFWQAWPDGPSGRGFDHHATDRVTASE